MVATRERKELTQSELATRIGTTQNTISLIESGESSSSRHILPICKVLRIPVPMHYVSAEQQRWAIAGHRLEEINPDQFQQVLSLVETMISQFADAPKPVAKPVEKPKKPLRSIGRAGLVIGGDNSALRSADETPAEAAARKKR